MKRIAAYVGLAHSVERVYSKDTLQTLADVCVLTGEGEDLLDILPPVGIA